MNTTFDWRKLKKELFNPTSKSPQPKVYNASEILTPVKSSNSNRKRKPFIPSSTQTNTYKKINQVAVNRGKLDYKDNINTKRLKGISQKISIEKQGPSIPNVNSKFYRTQSHNEQKERLSERIHTCSSRERMLSHNQSDIFYPNAPQSDRVIIPIRATAKSIMPCASQQTDWSSPFLGSLTCPVNENASFDADYSKQRHWKEYQSPAFNDEPRPYKQHPTLASNDIIKRLNQNFSDVFGQELGQRDSVRSFRLRELPTTRDWINCDSLKCQKDQGTMLRSQRETSRSRQVENSSVLDMHSEYSKPAIRLKSHEKISNRHDSFNNSKAMLRRFD